MKRHSSAKQASGVRSKPTRGVIVGAIVSLLGGCATPVFEAGGDPGDRRVFSVALKNLKDRYIDEIDTGKTMTSGLAQLASIDDRLAIFQADGAVRVVFDGNVISEYPSPESGEIDDWAVLGAAAIRDARAASSEIGAEGQDGIYRTVFKGLIDDLDRYSRYLSPDAASRSRATRDGYGGIGITVEADDGDFVIRQVLSDTPAEKAGLRSRDRITGIDGKPVLSLSLNDVLAMLRGNIGDAVRITVIRPDSALPVDHEVVRDHIVPPSVTTRRKDGVLEISVSIFNQGTVGAVRRSIVDAVRKLGSKLTGIVLDLRNNPGGLLDQAIAVADLFLEQGRIVSTTGRHPRSNQIFDATPGRILADTPMAVLINGRSASAAEIVAVALRDSGRAVVIGSTSFGKGTVQTIVRLPNKAEMNITWARILAPTGQTLASEGIVPAVCTNLSAEKLEVLRKSLSDRSNPDNVRTAPGFAIQRQLSHFSADRRRACPPSSTRQDDDIDIARLLLSNGTAYAIAVAEPGPAVAER